MARFQQIDQSSQMRPATVTFGGRADAERRHCRSGDRRAQRGGKDGGSCGVAQQIDGRLVGYDRATLCPKDLRKRRHDDDAPTPTKPLKDGVGFIDHQQPAVPSGHFDQRVKRRDITVHRKDAVCHDEHRTDRRPSAVCLKNLTKVGDVAVAKHRHLGAGKPSAVDDRRVVGLVTTDQGVRTACFGKRAQNTAQLEQVKQLRVDRERSVAIEQSTADRELEKAIALNEAARRAHDATAEALRMSRESFDQGLITSLDLLQAERAERQAESQRRRAELGLWSARFDQRRSLGLPPL